MIYCIFPRRVYALRRQEKDRRPTEKLVDELYEDGRPAAIIVCKGIWQ